MSYMLPKMKVALYYTKPKSENEYIFPITGLKIDDALYIGEVRFFPSHLKPDFLSEEAYNIIKTTPVFANATCMVYVNVNNVSLTWKKACNDNLSIALMMIKQAIGFIYLTYYELNGYADYKKIVISENGCHEIEEGMGAYITESGLCSSRVSSSLFLTMDRGFRTEIDARTKIFVANCLMNNQVEVLRLKLFESLYYLWNETHALERILKMAAFLNCVFIPDGQDEEFPKVAKRARILLDIFQMKVNVFSKTGKLNEIMVDIYKVLRNTYSHGKIDLYNEFNVLHSNEYDIFYQVYMNVLLVIIYRSELSALVNKDDIITLVDQYRR